MTQEVNTRIGSLGVFDPQGFDKILKVAETLMSSDLVPELYRIGNNATANNKARANVMIALNMSQRMQADPLMVMQNLYIVYGRPAWSSQFLIACFNSCGRFSALQYKFEGERGTDDYGCYAWAVEHATSQKIEGTKVTMKMAKEEGWLDKKGSKWKTMPEQMLRYRAATFFIRSTAPELAMGLQTKEEIEDIRDVTPENVEIVAEPKKSYSNVRYKGIKEEPKEAVTVEAEIESEAKPVEAEKPAEPEKTEPPKPVSTPEDTKTLEARIAENHSKMKSFKEAYENQDQEELGL